MATAETAISEHEPLFLAPSFLVSISGVGIVAFPQLIGQSVRRAQRGVVQLIAELSRGDGRPVASIIEQVVAETEADAAVLLRFVAALRELGAVTTSPQPTPASYHQTVPAAPDGPLPRDTVLTLIQPSGFLVDDGFFVSFDHAGAVRARLSAAQLSATTAFGVPRSIDDAWRHHRFGRLPIAEAEFDQLVSDLFAAGMLRVANVSELAALEPDQRGIDTSPLAVVKERVAAAVEAHQRETAGSPGRRTPVVPVNVDHGVAPLSLALLVAHAGEHEGGRLREIYDFVPEFLTDEELLADRATEPSIFLFSNYVWTVERNLALSAIVKRVNPTSITIHGGPSTPKYLGDTEEFFARHDHVDIAVHGEGETTFSDVLCALDGVLPARLDVLGDVAGLTYRKPGGGVVRTTDRDRITDLDEIPSPYTRGLLDAFGAAHAGAIIETNRGCPYGCTFCDWGSATLSRIRKFSLDRVFAELEWSAAHKIEIASIADANFGIMERDVEIAQKIADLKREYGFPRTVATNYAKNTVKYLRKIIEIFADVEILTEGVVSLQSMDEPTLKIIRRSNIKLDKYNELSTEFRRSRLPLAADIMMGLPGSTPVSFRNDLQQCTNRDVRVRANPTQLLPNSPMNEPGYRREYAITAKPGEIVMETSTFTRAEWDDMNSLRRAYYSFDNWGVLRYVSRFVRQETGIHEVDFYDRVRTDAEANRHEWPIITVVLEALETYMAPPASWGLFVDEIRRFVTTQLRVADDPALRTALAVQLAHLPAPGREFPETIHLEHDFVSWQNALLAAREVGHRDDWEQVVPRLSTYQPADLTIFDPNDICTTDVGKSMGMLGMSLRSWELDSPAARPRLGATSGAGV
jgi:radical SAM superfamily enzyme YgiQ (UPF0313 family)